MGNKVYIATRLERHADHNIVRDALLAAGGEITYDWTTHGPVWRDGCDTIRKVSEAELDGVRRADIVVVLLPGGRGTHAELGMALALGKRVLLHSLTPDEHFGAVPETCAFYHHPLCDVQHGNFLELGRWAAVYPRVCHHNGCAYPYVNHPSCSLCHE